MSFCPSLSQLIVVVVGNVVVYVVVDVIVVVAVVVVVIVSKHFWECLLLTSPNRWLTTSPNRLPGVFPDPPGVGELIEL